MGSELQFEVVEVESWVWGHYVSGLTFNVRDRFFYSCSLLMLHLVQCEALNIFHVSLYRDIKGRIYYIPEQVSLPLILICKVIKKKVSLQENAFSKSCSKLFEIR